MPLGELEYDITVNENNAQATIQSTSQKFKELGSAGQQSSQQLNAVPQTFQTIVQEGNKVTTTTKEVQQTMQGTVTTVTRATNANKSWGSVLKDNVLAIGNVASGVIGLISQYTQLQRMQVLLQKQQNLEISQRHTLERLIRSHADAVQRFGANSREALDLETKINDLQRKHQTTLDQLEIRQQTVNERMADFAVNILPNIISISTGVIQVLQGFSKGQQSVTTTTIESTGAQITNAVAMKTSSAAAAGMVTPLNGVTAAEVRAGTAATVMGSKMRTALIRTGIGAILVTLGTALVAFTQNWYGFRDAVNSAGVSIGNAVPILRPFFDLLKQGGEMLTKILGGDVPAAAEKTADSFDDVTASGKDMSDAMKTIQGAITGIIAEMAGLDKKKDRLDFAKMLGIKGSFGKDLSRVIDNAITPGLKNLTGFKKLNDAFQSGIFDAFDLRKKGFLNKLAGTWKSRFREIADDLDINKNTFDPIIDVIKKGKGKTDVEISNEIASVIMNTPKIKAAIAAYDPALLAVFEAQYKNIQEKAKQAFPVMADEDVWDKEFAGIDNEKRGDGNTLETEKSNMEKILDDWKISASTRAKAIGEAVWKGLNDIWSIASTSVSPLIGWFDKNIWSPLNTFLAPAFSQAKAVADQVWLGLNDIWAIVSTSPVVTWLDTNVFKPLTSLLTPLYNAGKAAADKAWLGLNDIWAIIVESPAVKWVNDNIITPLKDKNLLTNLYNAGKDIGWNVLTGITDLLGPIADLLGPGLGQIVKLHNGAGQKVYGADDQKLTSDPTKKPGDWWHDNMSEADTMVEDNNIGQGVLNLLDTRGARNNKGGAGGKGGDDMFTALEVAAQKLQTALANLANQGANSFAILAKASSTNMNGMIKNLKVGEVGSQHLQTGIANLANQGSNSFSILAKASSTNMNGMIKNLKKGEVGAQHLQTGLANLANQGSNSLNMLAKASSKAMNGFINNLKKGESEVKSFISAINKIPRNVTVHYSSTGSTAEKHAEGGLLHFAKGGMLSAADGRMFTTAGPREVVVGDNPGGHETVAFIPHDNWGPTVAKIEKAFGRALQIRPRMTAGGEGRIPATIIINIGSKTLKQEIELMMGESVRAYLP